MKKASVVAIGILIVVVGIYFLIAVEPNTTVVAPWTIEAPDALNRVEIVPPEGGEAAMIVLERRDGEWWLTRPIESRASTDTAQKLDELFSQPIKTDDLPLDATNARAYLLDEPSAVRLSAYNKGADQPAVDVLVGKEIMVAQTGARRTYIKQPNAEKIYRAQAAMGDFVREPLADLRTRSMVDLDAAQISALTVTRRADADAADPEDVTQLKLVRDQGLWHMKTPAPANLQADSPQPRELDQLKVDALMRQVAMVRAAGFADDKKPTDVGLDPAKLRIDLISSSQDHVLRLGDTTEDQKIFAKFDDGPIFILDQTLAGHLHPDPTTLLEDAPAEDQN